VCLCYFLFWEATALAKLLQPNDGLFSPDGSAQVRYPNESGGISGHYSHQSQRPGFTVTYPVATVIFVPTPTSSHSKAPGSFSSPQGRPHHMAMFTFTRVPLLEICL